MFDSSYNELSDKSLIPNLPSGTGHPSTYGGFFEPPTSETGRPTTVETNLQATILMLLHEVQVLSDDVKILRDELANRPLASSFLLNELINNELLLSHPISVILEETPEECLARWPEVNAFGIGTTVNEAIHNLKVNICELYKDLSSRDSKILGEMAMDFLRILRAYIKDEK